MVFYVHHVLYETVCPDYYCILPDCPQLNLSWKFGEILTSGL